jgi:hypothetical protein
VQTERAEELVELVDVVRRRRLVDAVRKRNLLRRAARGDGAVGLEHELLDQPVRVVARRDAHADAAALLGEIDQRLRQVEVERAVADRRSCSTCISARMRASCGRSGASWARHAEISAVSAADSTAATWCTSAARGCG